MLLVIVFGAVFFTVLVALSGFVLSQNRAQEVSRAKAEAFSIAEAGLDHYRWYLSHFPGDLTDGTGHAGPYVDTYPDPEGGTAGTFSLAIVGNSACGVVQSIDVTSAGTPADAPSVSSKIWARYAEPSVARFAMILGESTWFDGTTFRGPLQSNAGLRMDNTVNNSPVYSSLASWSCDGSFGCSPTQTVAGIFGTGANQNLWAFPMPQTNFQAIASSYTTLKTLATTAGGLYFARTSTNQKPYLGYHIIFNANDTVTVKKVTSVNTTLQSVPVDGSTNFGGFAVDYSLITAETVVGTYAVPANCGLIFVEDNAWIEGTVAQKVTVIAANATLAIYPNIVLPNNVTYTTYDGSVGLTAVASHNLLIGPNTPQNLTLDGIFVAQSGAFGRNMYDCSAGTNGGPYQYKGALTMLGTIVSMKRQNNYWLGTPCNGGQTNVSGYPDAQWNFVFDRQNSTNPPPFTPVTSTQWQFIDWQQK